MAFGVTPEGFKSKRLSDIKSEIEKTIRSKISKIANLLASSIFATYTGIFAEREAAIWEHMQNIYDSQFPNTSGGVSLDNSAQFNGVQRQKARATLQQSLHLFGTVGTVVTTAEKFQVTGNTQTVYSPINDVTLVAGLDEVQTITFDAVPDAGSMKIQFYDDETVSILFSDNAAAIQTAINNTARSQGGILVTGSFAAGLTFTFAGDDGKQDQPNLIISENLLTLASVAVNITVVETTKGIPQATVDVQAEDTGPFLALAFSLDVIVTPVSGLDRVINLQDAVVGQDRENDGDFRARRENSLQASGAGTIPAIESRLRNVEGVTAAIVFENDSDVIIDGLPPHSLGPVVEGGDEQDIADEIYQARGGGIATSGTITKTVTTSQGQPKDIMFSRPTSVPIFVSLDITTDGSFPANGAAVIEQQGLDFGNALGIGTDVVVFPDFLCSLQGVPGITNVRVRIDDAAVSTVVGAPAVTDNIVIASNEISSWDSLNFSVNII